MGQYFEVTHEELYEKVLAKLEIKKEELTPSARTTMLNQFREARALSEEEQLLLKEIYILGPLKYEKVKNEAAFTELIDAGLICRCFIMGDPSYSVCTYPGGVVMNMRRAIDELMKEAT